ncbi:type II secretion system F family protein [Gardnerella greenwoodii]|uniref:Flp pilus assembly protein n=1 Tax=Gardnerella greenwoodii 00703Dmash TaxID=698960 RepID=I4MB77_9BIFI|nr:type II secretion system F family protein [Gardnerella greenwoodii]EIK86467.1 Flp pilus assembly protein [Gardnerella greenwoodii 00703Dmash]
MEYNSRLLLIVPVFVIMAWQFCNISFGSKTLLGYKRLNIGDSDTKYEWRNAYSKDIDPLLGLHMIIVALRSGVAIPRALNVVGAVLPGGHGLWMCEVSRALISGDSWHEAWSPPHVRKNIQAVSKSTSRNKKLEKIDSSSVLATWLMTSLRESWCNGSSPVPVLLALSKHYEITMENVARQETSRLSVRLLLPVGLCFLPAFICIGIIPTVASLMR